MEERNELKQDEAKKIIAYCEYCGEPIFEDDDFIEVDLDCYHDACIDDAMCDDMIFYCEYCGEYHDSNEQVKVYVRNDFEYWCERCTERHAYQCEDCGDWFSRQSCDYYIVYRDGVERQVCHECSSEYCYCEECGRDVYWTEYDSEREMCYDCCNECGRINSYHSTQKNKYFGQLEKNCIFKGVGVELEIDRDDGEQDGNALIDDIEALASGHFVFEHDGSLQNGFEIISQPHTVEEFYKIEWGKILTACINHGYTSHDNGRCGLHFHFSRTMLGCNEYKQQLTIAKLIYFFDKYYNDVVKISRRTQETASRWAGRTTSDSDNITPKKATDEAKKHATNRYTCLNLTNKKTIEIRIMRGTLKLSTFLASFDFCHKLIKNAKKIKWSDIDSLEKWFKGMDENTLEYINNRNAFKGGK